MCVVSTGQEMLRAVGWLSRLLHSSMQRQGARPQQHLGILPIFEPSKGPGMLRGGVSQKRNKQQRKQELKQ